MATTFAIDSLTKAQSRTMNLMGKENRQVKTTNLWANLRRGKGSKVN